MTTRLYLTFNGEVFVPDHPVPLPPNTRVRMTIETQQDEQRAPKSFLEVARTPNLDGPADWSTRLDDYLYGPEPRSGE